MTHMSSTGVEVPSNVPVLDVDPFAEDVLESPFAMHEAVRRAGSAAFLERYGVYVMGRYAEVQPALKDWERFSSAAGVALTDLRYPGALRPPTPLTEVDPPEHTKVRLALQRILSPKRLHGWRDIFASEADDLIARLATTDGPVDAAKDLSQAFVARVFPAMIGWEPSPVLAERLFQLGDVNFNSHGPRNERYLASLAIVETFTEWSETLYSRGSQLPGGFGEDIYNAADREEFEPDYAPALIRGFARGGLDTSSATISAALHYLAQNPDQYQALRENPKLARNVLDETMRLETPIQSLYRLTTVDCEMPDGLVIPRDNRVKLLISSANRDPGFWTDPDTFDIHRKTLGHVALGVGPHMCIGQMIARMEGELILQALIRHVHAIEPAGPVRRHINNNLRSMSSVPVILRASARSGA